MPGRPGIERAIRAKPALAFATTITRPDRESPNLMKTRLHCALAALGLIVLGRSTAPAAATSFTPEQIAAESARAADVFERAFQAELEHSPEFQTELGIKTNYDRWDDRSDAAASEQLARRLGSLAELQRTINFAALDDATRLSYRLFVYDAEQRVRSFRFRHYEYEIDQTGGPFSYLPAFLINSHQVNTVADARAYLARLRGLDTVLAQITTNLDAQVTLGIVPPRWVFPRAAEVGRNVIAGAPFDASGADSPLWADFQRKVAALPEVDEATRAKLLADARAALVEVVRPAVAHLLARWDEVAKVATDDDGVWKFPEGAAYYDYRLADLTTTALTAEEIHAIGLREVARIQDEIRALRPRLKFTGELPALFRHLREDPRFYLPDTPAGRQVYLQRATAVVDEMRTHLDELFLRKPRAAIVVKATEPFREKSAPKAFYQAPAPDGSRPGMYYVTLYNMHEMPTYQLASIAYHEGIPGHHMQIAIAQELKGLPRFRRFGGFGAYVEGWGLYAERLPKEIGLYQDPYSDLGRLMNELWRAVRLVVDTGIHAKRWTRQQAIDFFLANTSLSEAEVVREVERYITWPGQATTYKIGMLKILELRALAERELGKQYDVRAFNDVVLRDGAVPLDLLEEQVRAWIAATKAQ